MEELRRLREEKGWSQTRLAQESGVDRATINQAEGGRRSPTITTLEELAAALGVEVADFFPKTEPQLPLHDRTAGVKDAGSDIKGPDESVWGDPRDRPGPEEQIPESAGRRIHVKVQDDLSTDPARVEITYEPFLDVLRRYGLTRRAAEEAFEELRRKSA